MVLNLEWVPFSEGVVCLYRKCLPKSVGGCTVEEA
jgi:hypothetical protein